MALPIQDALGFTTLDALLKSTPTSEIPRVNRGIYFCDNAGNGQPRWALYLSGSTDVVDNVNIYYPRDTNGDDITNEGRWILFEGGGSGGGGSSDIEIIFTTDGPNSEDPPTYGYDTVSEVFSSVGISFLVYAISEYGSFLDVEVYVGADTTGNNYSNGWVQIN